MHRPKEYGRRLPLLLLFLVLGLQICPVEVGAENAKQESAAPVDPVAVVEPQIRAFADTIDQGNANTNAAMDLAVHGMFGNGSRLTMDATSPMAATLLNSEVVQEGFAVIFGDVIQTVQRLDLRAVPGVRMSFEWYTDAVLWAVEQEITNGTGTGEFSPLMKCSRSQIVTFLYRAKG